jgi:predicted enzyme related to lactoylglutathione lyase
MKPSPFLGLRTVVYPTGDLDRAKQWYGQVLGIAPYFDQPFYAGFNVGGFELGLLPERAGAPAADAAAVAYWGVADIAREWQRLLGLGATEVSAIQDVGEGIKVATLRDPFGNLLGIIENPYFPNAAD